MADPITPNTPNVDGLPITICCEFTSGGAAQRDTFDLPTYAPLIDLRIGHPVLSMFFLSTQTDATGSQVYNLADEMARGTDADSDDEWDIYDLNTIGIYHAADEDGLVFVSYIPFGSQQA